MSNGSHRIARAERELKRDLYHGKGRERSTRLRIFFFFFQAEDGIRDYKVTGVQTCALPISRLGPVHAGATEIVALHENVHCAHAESRSDSITRCRASPARTQVADSIMPTKIGRASCRERV